MTKIFILGVAGAFGTMSRYLLAGWFQAYLGSKFPYGTLLVNISGSLAIGFFGTLSDERLILGEQTRLLLLIGFLGAFTTFSSFTYDTWILLKNGSIFLASCNVLGSFFSCFTGLALGIFIARWV